MKAIIGSWDTRPHHLQAELAVLRQRVAALQAALDKAEQENAALRAAIDAGLGAPDRIDTINTGDTAHTGDATEDAADSEIALTGG